MRIGSCTKNFCRCQCIKRTGERLRQATQPEAAERMQREARERVSLRAAETVAVEARQTRERLARLQTAEIQRQRNPSM